MRLFENRSLSLILCVMLGGFVIYTRTQGFLSLLPILVAILLLAVFIVMILVLNLGKKKKRRVKYVPLSRNERDEIDEKD